jgi:WD40 repeat protein
MGSGGPWGGLAEVIAAGCGPVVKLWAPSAPQQAAKINEGTPVYCVDFSHNNRVLAVAGEKGQANLYSSKAVGGSATYTPVSCVPTTPLATVDSITCVKFAPNDSALLGGCRNGRVHIWSLKGDEVGRADAWSAAACSTPRHMQQVQSLLLGNHSLQYVPYRSSMSEIPYA